MVEDAEWDGFKLTLGTRHRRRTLAVNPGTKRGSKVSPKCVYNNTDRTFKIKQEAHEDVQRKIRNATVPAVARRGSVWLLSDVTVFQLWLIKWCRK